ncbi:MAG: hypothetical protein HYX69_10800 [Planctomycetia bacterium]|nr:hypothetical protein [Planctomycetia bacterium]
MQRTILGIVALALLAVGLAILVVPQEEGDARNAAAVCLRSGTILAALWLALPDVMTPRSRWVVLALIVAVFFLARSPKLIPLILAALVAFALLRPRIAALRAPGKPNVESQMSKEIRNPKAK